MQYGIRRILPTLASAFVLISLIGCNGGRGSQGTSGYGTGTSARGAARPRVVFITNGTSPFWDAVTKGMQDGAAELGVDAVLRTNEGQTAGQIEKLKQVMAESDVQGVAISVFEADAQGVADLMKQLRDKGVHVITVDADGKPEAREAYVGTNNVVIGRAAGRAASAILPEGGEVVAFVGTTASANARERVGGFKEGAGEKLPIKEVYEDQNDTTGAAITNVRTAMQNYPDLKMLLGIWSYNAPAITNEVRRADRRSRYKIVAFDAEPVAINAITNGMIDAMAVQNPYEMGTQGVKLLKALIERDQKTVDAMVQDGVVYTGMRIVVPDDSTTVTAETVAPAELMKLSDFKAWLASKGLQGS